MRHLFSICDCRRHWLVSLHVGPVFKRRAAEYIASPRQQYTNQASPSFNKLDSEPRPVCIAAIRNLGMRGMLFLVKAITACAAQKVPAGPFLLRQKSNKRHFSAISATMGMDQRLVLWFRNDLRLTDNAALQTAATMIRDNQAAEVSQSLSSA